MDERDAVLAELEKHQLTTAASRAESESKHATSLTDGFVKSLVALAAGVMSLGVSVSVMFPQPRNGWLLGAAWVGLLGTVAVGLLLQRLFRDLTTLSYKKQDALYKQAFLSCLKNHGEAAKLLQEVSGLAKKEDEEFRKYFRYESALVVLFLVALLLLTVFGIVNLWASPPSAQADFDAGLIAFQKGEYTAALREFRASANGDDPRAMLLLGTMYHRGIGVPQSYEAAAKWYRKAADLGEPGAQHNLGVLYTQGDGVPHDASEAIHWYHKAASQGYADSQYNLGVAHDSGDGVPQDSKRAAHWFKLAAERGNPKAAFNIGLMAAKGESVPKDYVEAYMWASVATAHASKESRGFRYSGPALAETTAESERVSQMADTLKAQLAKRMSRAQIDEAKRLAVEQLQSANKDGFLSYLEGDYVGAFDKLILMAEKGDPDAQAMIGLMYEEGKGVGRFYPEALRWYRRAASQGNASAQTALGAMYSQGKGVAQDYREAVRWYKEAAQKGDADAQAALGEKYFHGQGVLQDYKESARWYRLAAEQGHAAAQYNLGADFANGQGVARDYVEAYKWFSLSAAQGNEYASKYLTALANAMTKEQITQAEDLFRKWKSSAK